jgi:hypothetical protein
MRAGQIRSEASRWHNLTVGKEEKGTDGPFYRFFTPNWPARSTPPYSTPDHTLAIHNGEGTVSTRAGALFEYVVATGV